MARWFGWLDRLLGGSPPPRRPAARRPPAPPPAARQGAAVPSQARGTARPAPKPGVRPPAPPPRETVPANAPAPAPAPRATLPASPPAASTPAPRETVPARPPASPSLPLGDEPPPPPAPAAEAAWGVGDVIADLYEVRQVHAAGGMGLVYRVYHRGWGVELALKSPRPECFATEQDKANFERECETWVGLGLHPHVVSCFYVRRLEGIPRVFAEYVAGGSLRDWIADGRLYAGGPEAALARSLDLAVQVAWGLQHAHEQGLVHQDVKPANVLVTADGIAKVTDFGLANARPTGGGRPPTEAGGTLLAPFGGLTPAYCSPEQAALAAGGGGPSPGGAALTRRTDLWSWAVLVLEMFTGEVTWLGGQVAGEALEAYLAEAPPPGKPRLPAELAALLRQCLRVEAERRPRDFAAVVASLLPVYESATGQAYPRRPPRSVSPLADALNNRAISLLDLGDRAGAGRSLEEALRAQPGHPEATYNRGLLRWRDGAIGDTELLTELAEVRRSGGEDWTAPYLLGLIHLERGDRGAALACLTPIAEGGAERDGVRRALAAAREAPAAAAVLSGHADAVRAVAVCPDGRLLSASGDRTLRLWEAGSGSCQRSFAGHASPVESVALSGDGSRAVSGGWDGLRIWEVASGRCLAAAGGNGGQLYAVAMSRDGRFVLVGGQRPLGGAQLLVLDLRKERPPFSLAGHTDRVVSIALRGDGRQALTGSWDKSLRLWDLATGACLRELGGPQGAIHAVGLSGDGTRAVSGGADGSVALWDLATGACLRSLAAHAEGVYAVALDRRAARLATGGGDGTVRLWELATGQCLRTFTGHAGAVRAVAFCDDGRVASGGEDRTVRLWPLDPAPRRAPLMPSRVRSSEETQSARETYAAEVKGAQEALARREPAEAARRLRRARALPGFAREAEAVQAWGELYAQLPRTDLTGGWEAGLLQGHRGAVRAVAVSRSGRHALSAGEDGAVRHWDLSAGRAVRALDGHRGVVQGVDLSGDGGFGLSTGEDHTARLWELASGRPAVSVALGESGRAASLSPDARWGLAGGDGGGLAVWDTRTGRLLRRLAAHQGGVAAVCFTPDGLFALSGGGDGLVKLWDLARGRWLRSFRGHAQVVRAVAASPDGRTLLSGDFAGRLRHWDLGSGRCLGTLEGHAGEVGALGFLADGRWAVSGGADGALRVWDLRRGACLRTFEGHRGRVNALAASRDGRLVVSGGADGTLRVWLLDWELAEPAPGDGGAEALRPYLDVFLARQAPPAGRLPEGREPSNDEIVAALSRRGTPTWDDREFALLRTTLGWAGFGGLEPAALRGQLETLARAWTPPCLVPPPPEPRSLARRIREAAERIETLAHPVLRPDPATGVDPRELLRMGGQALRGMADRLETGRTVQGEPLPPFAVGYWLFVQASDLHGLLVSAGAAMPPEALRLALRLVWAGRKCFGEPLEAGPRGFLVERLEALAGELERIFQRPEKPFPPSPVDFKRLLQQLVGAIRDAGRYLRTGVGDAERALTPEEVGVALAKVIEGARSKELAALYGHSFLTQYVQIMGGLGQVANLALLLHPDEVYTIQEQEEEPPAPAPPAEAGRPPAVVTPRYGLGSLQYEPQGCPRLGGGAEGLDLNRQDFPPVPFADLRLVSAFVEPGNRLRLLLFLRGQARPLLAEAEKIRFSDFPGVPGESLAASLRNLLTHLAARCPALAVDPATLEFMRGGPPPAAQKDRLTLATALAEAIQRGEAGDPPATASPAARGIVCPKCGAPEQREATCRACGIVFAKFRPEHQIRRCADLLGKAVETLPPPPAGASEIKTSLLGAAEKLRGISRSLAQGKDITTGEPVTPLTAALNLGLSIVAVRMQTTFAYQTVPPRLEGVLEELRGVARLLVPDPGAAEVRQGCAALILQDAARLKELFEAPELPLPTQPIQVGPLLTLSAGVLFPGQAANLVKGQDGEGKPVAVETAGQETFKLARNFSHPNFYAIFMQCFPSTGTEVGFRLLRLQAVGLILGADPKVP